MEGMILLLIAVAMMLVFYSVRVFLCSLDDIATAVKQRNVSQNLIEDHMFDMKMNSEATTAALTAIAAELVLHNSLQERILDHHRLQSESLCGINWKLEK